MESLLAERMKRIGFSPTLKISAKAKAMRAEGIDVIDLSVGEPDFPTPKNIREAGKRAIDEGHTKYTPASGTVRLKQAVGAKLERENGLRYDPASEIIVSSGAKNSLFHLLMAVVNKGDEVIVPAPYWVSYPEMVKLAKGVPVVVDTAESNGFRLTPEQLKASLSASTRAIILNNPSNPTGSAYSRTELADLCDIAAEEGLIIVADEIYEHLLYDGMEFTSIAALSDRIRARTVVVNGVSKAYSMTGWRIGYAAGPAEIVGAMGRIQSHALSNPCAISMEAAVEALSGPQEEIAYMREEFCRRRNYMHSRLERIRGVSCYRSEGAFYLFPNVSRYYTYEFQGAQIRNSYGMAYHLLRHGHVAIVPGDAFGSDPFIRLSYATSMEKIESAMDRIEQAISQLTPARKVKIHALSNTATKMRELVPTDARLAIEARDAMVAEYDKFLAADGYLEWNANIAGIIVQLRTNSTHLCDFYMENWYPAPLESDVEPHGLLYGVTFLPGRDAGAYYNSDTRTAFLLKSAYYGQLRSLALGVATDVAERVHDLHAVRGVVVDVDGKGILLLAPPGTGKLGFMAELMKRSDARLVSHDLVFVRYHGGEAIADCPERKLYLQTNLVSKMPALAPLFAKSKCENVPTKPEDTDYHEHDGQPCPLEHGAPYCFSASSLGRGMLDPYWIDGANGHVKRTSIEHVIILTRDPVSRPVKELGPDEAIGYVEEARAKNGQPLPFMNPHLLVRSMDRFELQRRQFRRLFGIAPVHVLNVERMGGRDVQKTTEEILGV